MALQGGCCEAGCCRQIVAQRVAGALPCPACRPSPPLPCSEVHSAPPVVTSHSFASMATLCSSLAWASTNTYTPSAGGGAHLK